jgi:flagellar basal body rod protein FlgB
MDSNTVDLDIERAHFAENVTKTEAQPPKRSIHTMIHSTALSRRREDS